MRLTLRCFVLFYFAEPIEETFVRPSSISVFDILFYVRARCHRHPTKPCSNCLFMLCFFLLFALCTRYTIRDDARRCCRTAFFAVTHVLRLVWHAARGRRRLPRGSESRQRSVVAIVTVYFVLLPILGPVRPLPSAPRETFTRRLEENQRRPRDLSGVRPVSRFVAIVKPRVR